MPVSLYRFFFLYAIQHYSPAVMLNFRCQLDWIKEYLEWRCLQKRSVCEWVDWGEDFLSVWHYPISWDPPLNKHIRWIGLSSPTAGIDCSAALDIGTLNFPFSGIQDLYQQLLRFSGFRPGPKSYTITLVSLQIIQIFRLLLKSYTIGFSGPEGFRFGLSCAVTSQCLQYTDNLLWNSSTAIISWANFTSKSIICLHMFYSITLEITY